MEIPTDRKLGSSMDGKRTISLNDMHCTVHFQYPLTRSEITLIHSAGQETFRAKLTEIKKTTPNNSKHMLKHISGPWKLLPTFCVWGKYKRLRIPSPLLMTFHDVIFSVA